MRVFKGVRNREQAGTYLGRRFISGAERSQCIVVEYLRAIQVESWTTGCGQGLEESRNSRYALRICVVFFSARLHSAVRYVQTRNRVTLLLPAAESLRWYLTFTLLSDLTGSHHTVVSHLVDSARSRPGADRLKNGGPAPTRFVIDSGRFMGYRGRRSRRQ